MNQTEIHAYISEKYTEQVLALQQADMVTVELKPEHIKSFALAMRDDPQLQFAMLVDLCGVDYLDYGLSYWRQQESVTSCYSRAVATKGERVVDWDHSRFAVVYHLLSLEYNQRLRIISYLSDAPVIDSVLDVWPSADWYEREAFDLFGIFFEGHPDLRRILTDYGFKGHPFRKDFPLIGEVEMRYDASTEACVYEPVSIEPRVLVPKIIRRHAVVSQELKQEENHDATT